MNWQEKARSVEDKLCNLLKRRIKEEWEANIDDIARIDLASAVTKLPWNDEERNRLEGENIAYEQVTLWLDSLLERGKK